MATERHINDMMGKALDAYSGDTLDDKLASCLKSGGVCGIRTGTSRRYRMSSSAIGSTHGWSPRVPLAIR